MNAVEPLLTPREIAAKYRVDPDTVVRWITRGVGVAGRVVRLEAVRVGSRYRVAPDALGRFLAGCNPSGENATGPAATESEEAVERRLARRLGRG